MLLEATNLSFSYDKKSPIFSNINISLESTEQVCLFAKSGFGKSTLAKVLSGYEKPSSGQILIDKKPIKTTGFHPVQLIYQHPEKAVNPRWRMKDVLAETEVDNAILDKLHIDRKFLTRYPEELSAGQLQKFCIARALSKDTKFLIADEITTMLDTITQAHIWNVLLEETKKRNIGLLVVTHNKFLGDKVCSRVINLEELCQT